MEFQFDLVGKIGSMALIRREDQEIDYNIISRLGADILMQNYRQFLRPEYGLRQILVEHTHFNDPEKREHIRQLLIRAAKQKTIPIINYNDPVSDEENRKMELAARREMGGEVHECVDNDETAAVIAGLVKAKLLVLMTSTEGIYRAVGNPDSLVREVTGKTYEEVEKKVRELQNSCIGASRAGANGARAKLEYALGCVRDGTTVVIGHARHHLSDLAEGRVPCTRIGVEA